MRRVGLSLDLMLLNRFITDGKPSALVDVGITPEMLFDVGKNALAFSNSFFAQHGKLPDFSTISTELNTDVSFDAPEPLSFYAEKVQSRHMINILQDKMQGAIKEVKQGNPEAVLDILSEGIANAKDVKFTGDDSAKLVDFRETTQERWDEYNRMKNLGDEIDGIPLPWPSFNKVTRGVHPGELWFIVARMKIGKTWSQIAFATEFWKQGYKVLLVSMEMPIMKISRRLDSMFAEVPYGDFQGGNLSTELEMKYAETLKVVKDNKDTPFWITGRGRVETTQDIEMLIEELKPDIVLVDGMYFLSVPGMAAGAKKFERVSMVVDVLQKISQKKLVPIVATTQFNRSVKKSKLTAGSESIGFAYEIGQNADVVMGMFQDEDMKASNQMVVELMEHREGESLKLLVNWDFSKMNMREEIGVVHGDDLEEGDGDGNEETIVY